MAYLTPPKATLAQLQGGEKIFPADITSKMMQAGNPLLMIKAAMASQSNNTNQITKQDIERLIKSNEKKNIIENHVMAVLPIENTNYYQFNIKN